MQITAFQLYLEWVTVWISFYLNSQITVRDTPMLSTSHTESKYLLSEPIINYGLTQITLT